MRKSPEFSKYIPHKTPMGRRALLLTAVGLGTSALSISAFQMDPRRTSRADAGRFKTPAMLGLSAAVLSVGMMINEERRKKK